ncbi:MAG: ABC transporter permease [Cytophagales bacterium]|nr:ABC transporter permease [Cytophagales bacterium]
MNKNQEIIYSPNYYARQRLYGNKPAMAGGFIILLCTVLALLGYLVMPDSTPNANDGAVQIQKQLPGFKTYLIKRKRNIDIEERNIIQKMFIGQESKYTILPVKEYHIKNFDVEVVPDGRIPVPETYPLIEIIQPGNGFNNFKNEKNYKYTGKYVVFYDDNGKLTMLSRRQLVNIFHENHLEARTYLLGTDKAGRDLLSRLIFGTRISLGIGLVSVLISLFLGITIGSLGGFFGGTIDKFVMWLMTVVWSIPGIMLVIAISLALQSKGIWVAFVAVGLTTWVEISRVVRGEILAIKEKTYIEAARALGIKNFNIILRHILPNLLGPIIVIATSNFASAILTEAGLSFLGLGVQPPMPSWGMMVNEGFHSIGTSNSWHLILFPGLAICILVLAFNLFGNGLRDAFDPKSVTN